MSDEKLIGVPKAVKTTDKFKVGCYPEEDGTWTAFIQVKQLPNEEAGKAAGTWLGNLLLSAATSMSEAKDEVKN